jgi:ABC-type branched-subunit amino acid transport system substrate-binding protein
MNRSKIFLASAALLVLAAAGCASSSSSSGGGSASKLTGTGSPVDLLVIATTQSPAFSYPESNSGAEAAADAINAAGGINGHPVKISTCNDQLQSSQAALCASQAVQDHVAAVVGGFSLLGPEIFPTLEQANIPWVGSEPISSIDGQSPMSFPLQGGTAISYTSMPLVAAKYANAKSFMYMQIEGPTNSANAAEVKRGASQAGVQEVDSVIYPQTVMDWSPYLGTVRSKKPDAILISGPESAVFAFMREEASEGINVPVISAGSGFSAQDVIKQGSIIKNLMLVDTVPPTTDTSLDGISEFTSDMNKYQSSAVQDSHSLMSWAAVKFVQTLASNMSGDVTSAKLIAAANKYDSKFLWFSSLSYSTQGEAVPNEPRIPSFLQTSYVQQFTGGPGKLLGTVSLK